MKAAESTGWEPVYRVVRRIPAGRVATYGQVARVAGMPRAARQVGYALHALGAESLVPWHRVVNAQGRISVREPSESVLLQRSRLAAEGISFEPGGRIDLARFGWRPRGSVSPPKTDRAASSRRLRGVLTNRGSKA